MIKNYLTIAWRNLTRHKTFSLINILGLSIGIAVCMLIFLYVRYELTYDQYNVNADRIVRVTTTLHAPESDLVLATSPVPLADAVQREFPEVESAVRLESSPVVVQYNRELIRETGFYKADQSVFSVFTFSFIAGTPDKALTAPHSLVLMESVARKYFGTVQDAMDKTLVCDGEPYRVMAVVADRPGNSDINIEGLLSAGYPAITAWMEDDFPVYTFVLFKEKPNLESFEKKLQRLAEKYIQPELDQADAAAYHAGFSVESLEDVHFSRGKLLDTPKGSKQSNYIFSMLAVFILVIALLNYINLTTAKATDRAKEVGIRKVAGARPFQLLRQFLAESFLLVAISWLVAVGIVLLLIPYFNRMLDTQLTFSWQQNGLFMAGIFMATVVLSGLYPAFILSRYRPVKVLKGAIVAGAKGIWLRKAITVTQFAIAIAMITGTVVVYSQVEYLNKSDRGFDLGQVISVRVPTDSATQGAVKAFYEALHQQPEVQALTAGSGVSEGGRSLASTFGSTNGEKRELFCYYFHIDPQFIPVFRIQLKAGRNLSDSLATDKQEAFLVNEAFVNTMGWSSAVGQSLEGFGHKGKVIGVVKNFYYKSMHNLVEPLVMVYNDRPVFDVSLKMQPQYLPRVKALWEEFFPGKIFDYTFLDDAYAAQYKKDGVTMQLFNYFTLLAILVSCLGLYGLVALITARRVKEIGIRKVLGASLQQITVLLTKGYIQLILAATLIALPVAGLVMHQWLTTYAYHITISWWMLVLPVVPVVLIALAVSSRQVIRAALSNPVESLRNE